MLHTLGYCINLSSPPSRICLSFVTSPVRFCDLLQDQAEYSGFFAFSLQSCKIFMMTFILSSFDQYNIYEAFHFHCKPESTTFIKNLPTISSPASISLPSLEESPSPLALSTNPGPPSPLPHPESHLSQSSAHLQFNHNHRFNHLLLRAPKITPILLLLLPNNPQPLLRLPLPLTIQLKTRTDPFDNPAHPLHERDENKPRPSTLNARAQKSRHEDQKQHFQQKTHPAEEDELHNRRV